MLSILGSDPNLVGICKDKNRRMSENTPDPKGFVFHHYFFLNYPQIRPVGISHCFIST